MSKAYSHDIIIVGAGIVGMTLACALACKTSLSILILESQSSAQSWSAQNYFPRVSAITLASQRIFKSLQVWDGMQKKRVSPFTKIEVWDAERQAEIHFDSHAIAESVLGFIIENNVMQTTLKEKLADYTNVDLISGVELKAFHAHANSIELLADGRSFKAKMAVAADGMHSWLREKVGIKVFKHDYDEQAIVANVYTRLPHQSIARQVFLASGPLAFLPLAKSNMSSIVWSLPVNEAKHMMSLAESAFKKMIAESFSFRLGEIEAIEERYAFALGKQQAQNYLKSRVVLVGDAAHTVHPLAGQGVNMGLLDAASLAEVIAELQQSRRDFSLPHNLRRYERWRKADNLNMLTSVDVIKKIFSANKKPLQTIRTMGLHLTERNAWIKNFFISQAVGNRVGLPRMAQAI